MVLLRRKIVNALSSCLLYAYTAASLFPIMWFFVVSFKPEKYSTAYPPTIGLDQLTLENYITVLFKDRFYIPIANSLIVCLLTVAFLLLACVPAAYILTRFKLRQGENMAFLVLSTRMIPPIVVAIPIFFTALALRLYDTHLILSIIYTGFLLSFGLWMLMGIFASIPIELEEAAMTDGCSRFGALLRVVLPLAASGVAATAIFCFIMSWNEFVLASILTSRVRPAAAAVAGTIAERRILWHKMTAAGLITVAPVLAFALIIQKYIVRALTFGYAR